MKMRSLHVPATALALALAVTACTAGNDHAPAADTAAEASTAAPASSSHAHAAASAPAPVLAEGQRWQTDEPLRTAMGRIHAEVLKNLPAFHDARLQAADAAALADVIDSNVQYMFAHCKLAPEPDAALHVLITRMLTAGAHLRENPASAEGMPELVAAINTYQATFDHEGMQPLTHD
ncbi:hypothetical protein ARC78_01260 [Stenotrophomonas pictorum JCM 9942]|uniref:DnrO protein n=1 Tax=Stenotrophomonas pictorum JCM 9942 TaxID=1236960 RepID=A0A0R0A2M3_9GAMM|nr:hypothetical protein [Stenotrophomonas pictorum]KRG39381.1 hypothetical protein ARC78_01260 [Stenotrophomonas pictorum JCM 9942]